MQSGESIEHPWVSKAIENAQRKVEAHNFDIRKNLLEYDDVANDQRKVVYEQRRDLMMEEDISENLAAIREDVVDASINEYLPAGSMDEQWDIEGLTAAFKNDYGLSLPIQKWLDDEDSVAEEEVRERIHQRVAKLFQEKQDRVGPDIMRRLEKDMMLKVLDNRWKEHLAAMDYLRQGIGLRGYAQKNPKQEYKREAFGMFEEMLEQIKHETISLISRVELPTLEEIKAMEAAQQVPENIQYQHAQADDILHPEQQEVVPKVEEQVKQEPYKRKDKKLGRNDPCHCGSGKKFKQCHGKLT
ncbi:MAG: SEC-C domain-containing protein [Gammaproteobacteria bacterium]|nr:SEC-C domain-containing protein [Gammaproteobacteria bacterium]